MSTMMTRTPEESRPELAYAIGEGLDPIEYFGMLARCEGVDHDGE